MAQSQVLQINGSERTKDREQSGEEYRERKLHRKRELRNNYNFHLRRRFEVFREAQFHTAEVDEKYPHRLTSQNSGVTSEVPRISSLLGRLAGVSPER